MPASVHPASPSGAVHHDGNCSSSSRPAFGIDPPTPHGHVGVAIADSDATNAKAASSSEAPPAALVQLMQRRLALPLVSLFPQLEGAMLKLGQAADQTQPPPSAKEVEEAQDTQRHNDSVMEKFAATANGQASVKLVEQQRQLEVDAQLALALVADKAVVDRAQLQSTRLYQNVPAMMLGEEMQRTSCFAQREQKTVWEHVLSMGLNFQSLFSATTTMSATAQSQFGLAGHAMGLCMALYVTILMGYSGGFDAVSGFLSFCVMWTIGYPLFTCMFLVPSTMEARTRGYLYEQMMNHGRVLLLRKPAVIDILKSFYMAFFIFSSCILLYTSDQTAAQVNLVNVILQGVTILLYYRTVYDVPSQLTPLVDVVRRGAKGSLDSLAQQTVVVREEDVVRDIVGIAWLSEFANKLVGEGSKEGKKYNHLLYQCLGVSTVVSQLGFLGFPDLSDLWTRVEPVVSAADRSALIDRLQTLDKLLKKEQEEGQARLAAEWARLNIQHAQETNIKPPKPFVLADRLPIYCHEPEIGGAAALQGVACRPGADAAKALLAEWSENEPPFSNVCMRSAPIAQAAAEVVVAATRAGANVSVTPLSKWPWNWRSAFDAWHCRAFWAATTSHWLSDAEHKYARKIFRRVHDAALFAVIAVEIYGIYKMVNPDDDLCANFNYDPASGTCLRK